MCQPISGGAGFVFALPANRALRHVLLEFLEGPEIFLPVFRLRVSGGNWTSKLARVHSGEKLDVRFRYMPVLIAAPHRGALYIKSFVAPVIAVTADTQS